MRLILLFPVVIISEFLMFLILYILNKNNNNNINNNINNKKMYKGLVLFDIDGTLTQNDADVNYAIVQYCIDNNFAVGICTAGPVYNMNNLLTYYWMPQNLYDFMIKNSSVTFNNVGSYILMGKLNKEEYSELPIKTPGYFKGFALEKTAQALLISNPQCMILCDDDKDYIKEALSYNKNLNVVCCNNSSPDGKCAALTISTVTNAMAMADCK